MQRVDHEPSSATSDRDWIFPLAVSAVICAIAFYAFPGSEHDDLQRCRGIAEDQARLACYDEATAPKQPAKGGMAPAITQINPRTGL
jgi:hypothetical protein